MPTDFGRILVYLRAGSFACTELPKVSASARFAAIPLRIDRVQEPLRSQLPTAFRFLFLRALIGTLYAFPIGEPTSHGTSS